MASTSARPRLPGLLVVLSLAILGWAVPGLAEMAEEAPAPAAAQADTALTTPAGTDTSAVPPPLSPPSGGPIIRAILARGFVTTDSIVVLRTFGLRTGDAFDPAAIKAGVRRLYATGLFADENVEDTA